MQTQSSIAENMTGTERTFSWKTVLVYAGAGFLLGTTSLLVGIVIDEELRSFLFAGPSEWHLLLEASSNSTIRFFPPFVAPLVFGYFGYRQSQMQKLLATQRAMQAEIEHGASHDSLTDLPNRVGLAAAVSEQLDGPRDGKSYVFAFLDLQRLKRINDAFGHGVGDQALKVVAERLSQAADVVARIGGDEFGVLLSYRGQWSRTRVEFDAQQIIEAVRQRIDIRNLSVSLGAYVGLYPIGRNERDLDEIIRKAGIALHAARQIPDGGHAFFDEALEEATRQRNRTEDALALALENGRFAVHFQPIVAVPSGAPYCFEALARWTDPERGEVSPEVFVPILEETGLIVSFGEWVLVEACRAARGWPDDISVAVNVSAVQFRTANLPAVIAKALKTTGLSASRLELEITESVLIHDTEHVRRAIHAIKALGVWISLDDFGTGYSSLNHLREFPFDRMKIDRSFMAGSRDDDSAIKILRSVIRLGLILGIGTVVEGVETPEDLELIAGEGATAAQGFLFSPPLPAAELHPYFGQARGRDVA